MNEGIEKLEQNQGQTTFKWKFQAIKKIVENQKLLERCFIQTNNFQVKVVMHNELLLNWQGK